VAFFLLWGGPVWTPVVAMLGFVVLLVAYRLLVARLGVVLAASTGVVLAILW
jgi:general L-amino acid transport system permease protein